MKTTIQQKAKCLFIFILTWMLVLTTFPPGLVEAKSNTKAGTLVTIKGEVFVKKGGGKKEIEAFEKMSVTQGDQVRTGKKSSVTLDLGQDNKVVLGENTKVIVSQLVDNKTAIKQSSGSVWNKVKSAGDNYKVETPTSIMGVRGTNFFVQVGGDGRTTLSVFDGIVGVNRPSSSSSSPGQEVKVDEQVSSESNSVIPTPSPLDIPQFVLGTDINILIQVILDELESAKDREQKALEYERLYESLSLPDHLTGAVEEAHLASLLAHIAESIMREIEQTDRYQVVQQAFRDHGISWEETYREVRNTVQQTERIKAEIERAAERDKVRQDRQEQLRRELQDKIDRHRSGQSTSPSPTSPATPPSSGSGGDGGGATPPTGTPVTATFQNGWAVASGTFNGIDYTLSIPQQLGDGNTISFTLKNPPSGIIPAGVGPIHAFDISGLDGRKVKLTMSIPEGLSYEPQAYHHEGNGRWEPRGTVDNLDGTITFETTLSAVAVAAKVPSPLLQANASANSVQLSWSKIEMGGVGYKLYRSTATNQNPVEIWSTTDYTDNRYIDTVGDGQTYFYTVKAFKAGFESMPSNTVTVQTAPVVGTVTGRVFNLNSPDQEPLSSIKIKVWNANRGNIIASGTTDSVGRYSIQVPAGGPYRITAEYIEEPGHAFEIYHGDWAVADLFSKHYYDLDNSDPYTFSVAKGADISIPDFSIVPYEKIENLTAEVSDSHFAVSWDEYPEAFEHRVYIYDNEYLMGSNTFTSSAQPDTTYEVGVTAWGSADYPLAIGLIEFTTDPHPTEQTETVVGAVRSEEEGVVSDISVKVWNQERTKVIAEGSTDGDGQFRISDVPVGANYRITAEYKGQVYEMYESGPNEYSVLSAFSVPPPLSLGHPPYTFSVEEGTDSNIDEMIIGDNSMLSQIENLTITEITNDGITIAWDPYQISNFGQYRVLVNGIEVGYVENNDVASTTYTIDALEPATYYEIAVGLWEGSDGATAVATMIFVQTIN